jgi:hypothetical protein
MWVEVLVNMVDMVRHREEPDRLEGILQDKMGWSKG